MPPVIEYRRVHRDDSLSMGYLKTIYNTLYPELFPDASDRESWDRWMHYLDHAAADNFFILAGENMKNAERAVIHGFVVGCYFGGSSTGLVSYIGVDKNCRSGGVATGLIDALTAAMDIYARSQHAELKALFAEANDPAQVEACEDSLPPAVRLKIYHRWNAVQVPVAYTYPSVQSPWQKEGCMLLLSLPVYGAHAKPDDVVAMIGDYYRAMDIDPEQDADFSRMRGEINDWRGYISLAPYDSRNQMAAMA